MTCRPAARPAAQESAGAEPSGAALLLGVGARAHPGDRPRPPPARTSAATRARAGRCVRAPLSLRGHLPYPYHDCAMKCGYGDVQLQFWHGNHQRRRPPPAGLHACARSPARCRGASCGPPRAPAARGRGAPAAAATGRTCGRRAGAGWLPAPGARAPHGSRHPGAGHTYRVKVQACSISRSPMALAAWREGAGGTARHAMAGPGSVTRASKRLPHALLTR